jgi:tetratricopeptide (TPR) repeat protein
MAMQVILTAFVALAVSTGTVPVLDPGDDGPAPSLTLPDGPTLPLPSAPDIFGPNGLARKLFPQFPPPQASPKAEDKPVAAPSAEDPDAHATPAERRKARIDDLFKRLAAARDETEANAIASMLDQLWLRSGSPTTDLLMTRALTAMASSDYKIAEDLLDKVVILRPGWTEAWNQRATVHYLDNDDVASMVDIGHVLALEPRHFGALSGMGFILHRNGDDKSALTVLRKAAAINPQNKEINALIEQLTPEVEGHDL